MPARDKCMKSMGRFMLARLKNPNTIVILIGTIAVLVLACVVPRFLTFRNISAVIVQASSTGVMAIGLTFVIITSGIDLSLPTTMALSAILGCMVMSSTQSLLLGVLTTLVIGIAIGCLNGFSVARLKMIPMIVTLAISTINWGTSNWITGAQSVGNLPPSFTAVFNGSILGLPVQALILLLFAAIMHLLLSQTIFGRDLFAIGVNERTARVNGVKTERIIFLVYVISGFAAGLAGILGAAKLNSAGPTMGPQAMFLDVVCAVVLGGASVMGGSGSIIGTVIGSLFIAVISNVMNLMNIDFFITFLFKGAIIIVIVFVDVLRNRARIGERE